ncbi:YdcF family protein [Aquihabitans sp. McL0605]|uniref:YdcF family protein n=1 Tax=Aquihabitans sp. McL0605 TaxID=3415671 RepID=UPI003CF3693B
MSISDRDTAEMEAVAGPEIGDGPGAPSSRRRRSWGRRTLWVALGLLALLVLYVGGTFVQVWSASRTDGARKAEAIIVLGAAQYNGKPSPVLRNRLDHALALYDAGKAPLIVVTGGRQQGDRYTEATAGYNYLRAHGVPDRAIRKEVQGRTTYESVAAAARFLREEGVDDVLLVSGPATSKRLDGIAADVGITASTSPSQGTPSLRSLIRETAAVSLGRLVGYRRLERLDS